MNKGVFHSFSLVSICLLEAGHCVELKEGQTKKNFRKIDSYRPLAGCEWRQGNDI